MEEIQKGRNVGIIKNSQLFRATIAIFLSFKVQKTIKHCTRLHCLVALYSHKILVIKLQVFRQHRILRQDFPLTLNNISDERVVCGSCNLIIFTVSKIEVNNSNWCECYQTHYNKLNEKWKQSKNNIINKTVNRFTQNYFSYFYFREKWKKELNYPFCKILVPIGEKKKMKKIEPI